MSDVKDVIKALKEELEVLSDTVCTMETLIDTMKAKESEGLCVEKNVGYKEDIKHNEYNSTLEDNYIKIEIEGGVIYFELKDGIIEYGINIKELLSFIEDSKAKVPLKERGVK